MISARTKILSVLCTAYLVLQGGVSWAAVSHITRKVGGFADAGMIVIETDGSHRVLMHNTLKNWLDFKEIPSTTGNMEIILSPNERIIFRRGNITDYFCTKEKNISLSCRAKIEGAEKHYAFGGIEDIDGLEFNTEIYKIQEGTEKLPPENIKSIDGEKIRIIYRHNKYIISVDH